MSRISYFVRETLISLRRNIGMTLAGILTVTVSLSLFGGVLLLSRMVNNGTQKWQDGVELEIFMNVEATQNQIDEIQTELDESDDVERYTYLSKDDAYEEFQRLFQTEEALVENVDADALPPSFRVVPVQPEFTESIVNRFSGRTGVDEVISADQAVKNMLTATNWVRWGFFTITLTLLVSSLFLIVNTIRLATFARRREIEVMKLVGASNWFVRVPFMAEGLVQGAAGAGVAFGLVYLLKVLLMDLVEGTENLFKGFLVTNGDAVQIGVFVLVIGAGVGLVGAAIGLYRFLDT